MQNPMVEQLNNQKTQAVTNQLKQIMNSANPQALLSQMIAKNPRFKALNQILSKYGNTKDAFYGMAKEMGVNPDTVLNALKN